MKRIFLPKQVETIINRLNQHGYEAYVVGGCVRDALLGRCPHDWDITTSASPEQVKAIFKQTADTGLEHGTVTVILDHTGFEVTTYRIDGKYEDGRHPKTVQFTSSLQEDLRRRDFTINAMAYNHSTGIVDLFGGQKDLENGIIRCVGQAEARFSEDALRIMRAVRFAAQLGFEIEANTCKAIQNHTLDLGRISVERIQAELTKLLLSPHPECFRLLNETGIISVILPELAAKTETQILQYIPANLPLRWAAVLYDLGNIREDEIARKILRRLKYDNQTVSGVCRLIRYHDNLPIPEACAVRHAVRNMGKETFQELLFLRCAEAAKNGKTFAKLQEIKTIFRNTEGQCTSLKMLAVTGNDLIAAGISPGKEIGIYLEQLLNHVLDHPEDNKKEILLAFVKGE